MNKTDFMKRMLVALLSLVITITYMPTAVFAAPVSSQDETQSETTVKSEPVSEDKRSEEAAATDAEVSESEEVAETEENSVPGEASEKEIGSDSEEASETEEISDAEKASDSEETTEAEDNSVSEDVSEKENGSDAEGIAAPEEKADTENSPEEKESSEKKEETLFVREAEIDDVIVKVEAEPGVFPDDAEIAVTKADKKEEAKAAEAIDEVRPDDINVADSYTFDIKVVDADGNELQPADNQIVNVTFNMARAADTNLSADVYHIAEREIINEETKKPETALEAEKLDSETDTKEETITAETDGFSLYTVEFTYGELRYVAKPMEGTNNKVSLQSVIEAVGLAGTVVGGTSRPEDGEILVDSGTITFLAAFSGEKTISVRVKNGGSTRSYDIKVSNYVDAVDTWSKLQNRVNSASSGEVIHLGEDITASSSDDRILIKGKTLTIDLNGHKLNRNRSSNDGDGHVIEIQNSTKLTIKDSSTGETGVITGGYATRGGGIHVGKGTTCTIEGGTITGNKADVDGGGIYVRGTLIMTGGTITKNEAKDTAGGIYCQDTGTFDISNVTISENTSKNDGGGLIVHLAKNARISNCRIINNKSKTEDGGAFRMEAEEKTLTIENNTEISGNECENQGGAIVIYEGKVDMTGGKISNNKAEDGGGVYNDGGTIVLNGVEVSGNKTTKEGGGGINNHNNATLKNCTIINNECKNVGGGLYTNDNMNITGCTFGVNKASSDGGAIHIKDSTVKIENCTFRENASGGSGGAIRCKDGNITITGSAIEENTAKSKGGGVCISDGADVNLSETEILANIASDCAGGVYVGGDAGKFKVSGRVVVLGNVSSLGANVFLFTYTSGYYQSKSKIITVSGELDEETNIGVTIEDEFDVFSRPITEGFNNYHSDDEAAEFFTAEKGGVQKDENGEVVFSKSDWPYLQAQINKAEDGSTLLIKKNWTAADTDKALTIPEGKTLTIDINGFTLDRNRTSLSVSNGGGVFEVNGNLTLIDSRGKGSIKGGNAVKGGGVYVSGTGSLTLESATISDNKATDGGGIYNEGRCNIIGGAIKTNAAKNGGAIYNASENLTVSGGDIITNRSTANGGGIYNASGAILELTTLIAENNAGTKGGGVYNDGAGTLNISGNAAAKGNSASSGADIMLAGSSKLNITDTLSDESSFDIVAEMDGLTKDNPSVERFLTSGLSDNGGEGAATKFSYDGKPYGESTDLTLEDGELVISKTVSADKWISSWTALREALKNNKNSGKTIALSNDIEPITDDDRRIDGILSVIMYGVDAPNVTLELCGHTIDRKGYGGSALTIGMQYPVNLTPENATLTIRDSVGTGAVTGGKPYEYSGKEILGGGIIVPKSCTCNLEGVTVRGNRMVGEGGGGIIVEGTLNMTGGGVSGNTTDKSGGGIYCPADGKINLTGVTVSGNTSNDSGGGINIKNGATISNCVITGNVTKKANGGGINFDANKTLTINNTEISENVAVYDEKAADISADPEENNGGGINVKKGTLNMTGGVIYGNRAENGGGVSCGNDAKVNLTEVTVRNNTVTGEDVVDESLFYDDETILGGHGGGIINKNDLVLKNCNIKENSAENTGGGIWTDDSVTIDDSIIASNIAESEGGGIHISSGTTKIKGSAEGGSVITNNTAYIEGSGVMADKSFHVEGKVLIKDNADSSNVFLNSGKNIILDSTLTDDSRIAVSLKKGYGIFTEKYKDYHPSVEPEKYFISDYGYGVHRASTGEAEIKLDLDDGSHFIDMDNRITDFERLNKRNWMSGISGDRRINEINIPCTHDAGMNNVNYHVMSSIGTVLRYKAYAKTQTRYIDEQLDDGVRRIDVRLNNRYEESHFLGIWVSYEDDGKNLWLCHGKSYIGGTFWAGNHKNDDLNLNEVFGWVKDFLQKHPTETIIMDFQAEPVSSLGHSQSKDTKTIYSRLRQILERESKEINPSTGEPYIYWQNGELKEYTSFPKLKDCRGKIVINSEEGGVGGIVKSENFGIHSYGLPPGTELTESAEARVEHVRQFFNLHCQKDIPKNVTDHLDFINAASTNCAPATLKLPYATPLEVADVVHGSLISEGKEFDQRGKYVGWIRLDGATSKTNRFIWISNFPKEYDDNELEYCTVTVKSDIDPQEVSDPDKVKDQTYKLLKGTEFPIPGDIYGYDKELSGWDASIPSGEETGSETQYLPDDTYKLMSDVTFTANWGGDVPTPSETTKVMVNWNDEDNADEIRPQTITVQYKTKGSEDSQTISFPRDGTTEEAWETTVEGEVTEVTSVSDGGNRIKPTDEYPQGQDKEDEYSYEVINSKLVGCTITLKHTPTKDPEPEEDVTLTGSISWDDNHDAAEKRPKSVVVRLMKNGEDTGIKREISNSTDWKWFFDLSTLEDYDPKATYTVSQNAVPYYTTEVTGSAEDGYVIKNTIVSEEHQHDFTEIDAKTATCLEDGNIKYWICNKGEKPCNRCFSDAEGQNEVDPAKTTGDGGIIIPATGHDWEAPEYTWADDNSTVTGKCICKNNSVHEIEETVNATSEITTQPTDAEEGVRTYTAIFKGDNPFEDQTKTEAIPARGHVWGETTYTWADDNSSVTAERSCRREGCGAKETERAETTSEVTKSATCAEAGETTYSVTFKNEAFEDQSKTDKTIPAALGHDLTTHAAVAATCTAAGNSAYYSCDRCEKFFSDEACEHEIEENSWVIPALGHDYGDPTYIWADDNSSVTAERGCRRDGCRAKETETAETTSEVTKPATCTEAGETTYAAIFENDAFEDQSRTDNTIPAALGHDWGEASYTWAEDNSSVTAKRVCTRDASHVEEETVETTSEVTQEAICTLEEKTKWTSKAFDNTAFKVQDKEEVTAAALGHDWEEPTYTWAEDNSSVTAERSCQREGCGAKETETAETTTKVIREATADEDGEILYTVVFNNEDFGTQTKTVVIPKTGASYDFRKGEEQTWYIGSDKTADFTIKRSANDSTTFSHFAGIKVDGKEVAEKHYTKEAGSVIIKLKPEYLNTLEVGKHTLTAEFDDGSVEATFNVAEKGSDDPGKDPEKDPDKDKDPDKKDNGSDNKGSDNDGDSGSDNSSDSSSDSDSANNSDNSSDSDSVNSAENDSDADADNGSDSSDSSVTRGKGAKTGDETDILTWLAIMLSTILAMTGYAISRRRR